MVKRPTPLPHGQQADLQLGGSFFCVDLPPLPHEYPDRIMD
jgi:hypothetical protein